MNMQFVSKQVQVCRPLICTPIHPPAPGALTLSKTPVAVLSFGDLPPEAQNATELSPTPQLMCLEYRYMIHAASVTTEAAHITVLQNQTLQTVKIAWGCCKQHRTCWCASPLMHWLAGRV
jgi:hypothetical protein